MKYVIVSPDRGVITTNSEQLAMDYYYIFKYMVVNTEERTVIGLEYFTKEETHEANACQSPA